MTSKASTLMNFPAALLGSHRIFTVCGPEVSVPVAHTLC
jgi:hypothetical protein